MDDLSVFVSVGGTATDAQEAFVRAVEDRLRSEGLVPHTVGRNTFSAEAPLKAVTELLDKCSGTVVIALERLYFESGVEKRGGPREAAVGAVRLPTPWNQIEAAMAYARGHPLLVIVESGLRGEGLLERGHDWYVQSVRPDAAALTTLEFNGVLASWRHKVGQHRRQLAAAPPTASGREPAKPPGDLTVGELLRDLKPAQLWALVAAFGALVVGAFSAGAKLFGG